MLATELLPDDLAASLARAIERLRATCAADRAAVFLSEPRGEGLWLAASAGEDETWTASGAIARDQLKVSSGTAGNSGLLTVPIAGARRSLGCLALDWRAGSVPAGAPELLALAAKPIATAIRAGLSEVRDAIEGAIGNRGIDDDSRRRAFLQAVLRQAGARSATLVIADGESQTATTVGTGPGPLASCQNAYVEGSCRCSVLQRGQSIVLSGPREDWPAECQATPPSAVAPCCMPLLPEDPQRGALLLDYGEAPPMPVGRDLVTLLAMGRAAADALAPARSEPVEPAQQAAPELELWCLGEFELRLCGQTITPRAFARRKALTLLKMLVLARGRPVHRDTLVERLWPGVDGRAGANRLHGVIHALRSAIDTRRDGQWRYVCAQGEFYSFNDCSSHWVDVHAFRCHDTAAHRAEQRADTAEAIAQLQQALELYRGDLFEDEPLAEWCSLQRAELRRRYIDAATRLAELLRSMGELEGCADSLRRGLAIDPAREDLHQALIQALADSGRRQEALVQYQECERVLRDQLGIDPLPATKRLARLLVD